MTNGVISGNTVQMYYVGSIPASGGYGGGVALRGDGAVFNMSGVAEISDNTAAYSGGGVDLGTGATFNMSGTAEISGNTATSGPGGGVYKSSNTTFNREGGLISGNTPDQVSPAP
jgi:hypothetical protein